MGKLTVLFAFAFIALQGCHAASFNIPRNEIEDLLYEFLDAIYDANGVISSIGDNLSPIPRNYEHDINTIVEENSGYPEIENLREEINKIESTISDDSKYCVDNAWRMVMLTTEELKRGIDKCVSEARTIGGKTLSIIQNLDGRANDLRVRLITGMNECMRIGQDNAKCLKDLIVILKGELVDLQKEVEEVQENVHKLTGDGIYGLKNCMDHVREDLVSKSETIIDVLKKCTQTRLGSMKTSPRGILDLIAELKKKIENIIDIVTNLPSIIADIPDKIQEIISHLNIASIARQLKNEIDDIIDEGGRDAEDCRPEAEQRLDDLVDNAQKTAKACMDAADEKIEEIKTQISSLIDDAKNLLSDFNKMLINCAFDNPLNPIGYIRCLEEKYNEFKKKVADFQKQLNDLAIPTQADEILKGLATCVNRVQIDTVNQGQVLIKDVEKCVRTIHYL